MHLPTAQEISILQTISASPGSGWHELVAMAESQGKARALEGCIAKGYIEIDGNGTVRLTRDGAACI